MTDLTQQTCKPCEGGVAPLDVSAARDMLSELADGWALSDDGKEIRKDFEFKGFYKTMAFVNAVAWIANQEGHHPDLEVGYRHCLVRYTTHAIDGLSINDFICAAKIDALILRGPGRICRLRCESGFSRDSNWRWRGSRLKPLPHRNQFREILFRASLL